MTRFVSSVLAAGSALLLLLASPTAAANATDASSGSSAATVKANANATASGSAVDGVILVRGNKMYNAKTGARFFIKGVREELLDI
jgi:hypothetical protein